MSLSTTACRVSYAGNGTTTEFSFPYKYVSASDLKVYLYDEDDGSIALQTAYTVTPLSSSNGVYSAATITFTTAPGSDKQVRIMRDPPATNEFDFDAESDPLPVLNRHADLLAMMFQAVNEKLGRTVGVDNAQYTGFDGSLDDPIEGDADAGDAIILNSNRDGLIWGQAINGTAVGNLMASWLSSASWATAAATAGFMPVYTPERYGAVGDGSSDDTDAVQDCFDAAAAAGVPAFLLQKTYVVQGLSIPAGLMLFGAGDNPTYGSTLKLKGSTNTYIAATSGYVSNSSAVTYGGIISGVRFDGNKSNQASAAPLLILRTYRQHVTGCSFYQSKGRGILITPLSADTTVISNGMAENHVLNCNFDECDQEGIYGEDQGNSKLADLDIESCNFNACGQGATKKHSCYLERGSGMKLLDNQFYGSGKGELYIAGAGRTIVVGNHFDITNAGETSGTVNNVEIVCTGTSGHAHVVISGNLFHTAKASAGAVTWRHLYVTGGGANSRIIVDGNTFYSHSFAMIAHGFTGTGTIRTPDNVHYQCTPQATTIPTEYVYADNGASEGPLLKLTRISASPAANDAIGGVVAYGYDSAGNEQEYGVIRQVIADATSTSEDGTWEVYCTRAGTRTLIAKFSDAIQVGASATNTGAGTVNADSAYYVGAVKVKGAGIGSTVTIALATGGANEITITVTVKDPTGATVAAVHELALWTASDSAGTTISTTAYSGSIVATTGKILHEQLAKHFFQITTASTGVFVGTWTDSGKPATEYIAVRRPDQAGIIVSAASGTTWG